jgi:hypothetical protein
MDESTKARKFPRRSGLVRAVIALLVFAVGVLGGAGVAALLMPT